MKKRCDWVGSNENMIKYHDKEWGVPCHDDKKLFEYFVLDTFQAGLSWQIVLNKRKGFKKAFPSVKKVAKYTDKDVEELVLDASIIRNRLKIKSTILNAQKFLEVKKEFGSFSKYIWHFTKGKVIKNKSKTWRDLPTRTDLSDEISKDLKKRGFKFVGTTIVYAFIQAIGIVNDHSIGCFRYNKV